MFISEYTKVFGKTSVDLLPQSFIVEPIDIKDQGANTDKCSFFAIASCFEEYAGEVLYPEETYRKAKRSNQDIGFRLSDAITFACENGFPRADGGIYINKCLVPFKVGGTQDTFDNIRTTIFSSKHSLVFTAFWKPEWTFASHGIVQDSINPGGEPHAFRILGWNKDVLVIQNSRGDKVGDKGLFYFTRDIVNKNFISGYAFVEVSQQKSFTLNMFRKIVSSLLKCYNDRNERSNS